MSSRGRDARNAFGVLILLVALVLAALGADLFVLGDRYLQSEGCWPWQELTTDAGSTFCDGSPARHDID